MTSEPHRHHSHPAADVQVRREWLSREWSFLATALPPAPARLLEIGCGAEGGIVPAALDAGYEAVGVDPRAPDGEAYRQLPFEAYEPAAAFDAVVSMQALHHLPDLNAAVARIERMLAPSAVLAVVEWAWERIDEATARWLFDHSPSGTGWAGERRADWQASGLPWPRYRDRWAAGHGLHTWRAVEAALASWFDVVAQEEVPALFGDVAEVSEELERAAIAAGEVAPVGVHWVGRRRASV